MIIQRHFMDQRHCDKQANSGYIVLISVLVVSAVGAAVAMAVILFGLGSSRNSFSLEQSAQSRSLANACAEEALQQIRDNSSFSDNSSFPLGQGLCEYNVADLGAENRFITASGTVGTIVRKSQVSIDAINPVINITSWLEVADF